MPPVYNIPPASSKISPPTPRSIILRYTGYAVSTTDQPMMTYIIIDSFLNLTILIELSVIPSAAQPIFMPKSVQPIQPRNSDSDTGMYVPSIRKNIEQWSKI